jgi:hypothetical protein
VQPLTRWIHPMVYTIKISYTMKKMFFLLFALALFTGCKDKIYHKYLTNNPVYTDYETFRNMVKFENPKPIQHQAGIYKKDGYLFIIESNKGIHFIENTNLDSPLKKGFLTIPGCSGMAISGSYLYANSLIDLVVIDISDLNDPKEVGRTKNAFPQALPATNNDHRIGQIDKSKGVVTAWELKETKEEITIQNQWLNCPSCMTINNTGVFVSETNSSSSGLAGSITKFSLVNNHLYIMDGNLLHPIDLINPIEPAFFTPVTIWREVETLFAYNSNLFLGTTSGMLIYTLANPKVPTYASEVNHLTACDPVVVQGNKAYVTTRSGRTCGGEINQLDVIDITSIHAPVVLKSYNLFNPHGLGIDGDLLFICDGTEGLKVFNAANPLAVTDNLIKHFSSMQATDVIVQGNNAIVIGTNGLYQYDYSNPQNIQLRSTIHFN